MLFSKLQLREGLWSMKLSPYLVPDSGGCVNCGVSRAGGALRGTWSFVVLLLPLPLGQDPKGLTLKMFHVSSRACQALSVT